MRILAIVPARSGSKGFPNKNIAKIHGVTLLEWAVRVAKDCRAVSDVYVSTDSETYESIALAAGAKSAGLRPAHLASDTAKTVDVVLDLLDRLHDSYDYVVLLQPTSPIRNAHDIEAMIKRIDDAQADAAASVARLEEPHPHKLKTIGDDGFIKPFIEGTSSEVPRQALPPAYLLNGALYVVRTSALQQHKTFLPARTVPYLMDRGINVDTPEDFMLLESMFEKGKLPVNQSLVREKGPSERLSIEIIDDSKEVDVILGHDKPILRGYRRNNVKMVGGWYLTNITQNTELLAGIITKHALTRVNFIGTSKSCSGAIILTKELTKKFPEVVFNLFLFSPYTTLDKDIYLRRKIDELAPGSLKSFWNSEAYTQKTLRLSEARGLVNKANVFVNIFYPEKSKRGEPVLAQRVAGPNVVHIGMPVWLHNTLYPLWKKVQGDMTIEIYESEFREMEPADFDFYTSLQRHDYYRFDLYSCVEDIDRFVKNLEAFKANWAAEMRKSGLRDHPKTRMAANAR